MPAHFEISELNESSAQPPAQPAEHYSHEVTDIISARPAWIVRNGISLFFIILMLTAASTYFIKYPDVVQATAKLTSANAPKEVKLLSQNRLVSLQVKEQQQVEKGQILGLLESNASPTAVLFIDSILHIVKGQTSGSIYLLDKISGTALKDANLGELQSAYQIFSAALQNYKQYGNGGYFLRKRAMLFSDITYLDKLNKYLLQQKNIHVKDLDLSKRNYEANQSLSQDKVIADLEMRQEESKYLGKQMTLPQINTAITNNESARHEKQKEIAALDNEIKQEKLKLSLTIEDFAAAVTEWKRTYLLIAPVAGKVVFPALSQVNKIYKSNETFCFIDPGGVAYRAELNIPQSNFGKIKEGQKINLKFPAYPFQEFGVITSKLSYISTIPTDSGFVAIADFSQGLTTNYKKVIQFREGLTANAEIVTDDRSLLDRLLSSLYSAVKN